MRAERLSRYLLMQTLIGVGIAGGVVLTAILMIDLVEQMRTLGARADLGILAGLRLTLLKTPQILEQTLPFVVLIGVMITFWRLARRSEVTAMRAAGVSAWRFLAPTAVVAAGLGVVGALALNPMGAAAIGMFERERAALLGQPIEAESAQGEGWLRQSDPAGQTLIRARTARDMGQTLDQATFFVFEIDAQDQMRFARRYDAREARLRDGFWQLTDVVENRLDAAPARTPSLALPSTVNPQDLLSRFAAPETTGFWELPRVIATVEAAGLSATPYALRWHRLMSTPVALTAMALLAALFSLGIERFGGRGRMAFLAVTAALSVYLANDLSGALAQADVAPAWAAAWCPTIVALFLALWAISVREDG